MKKYAWIVGAVSGGLVALVSAAELGRHHIRSVLVDEMRAHASHPHPGAASQQDIERILVEIRELRSELRELWSKGH